MSGLFALGVERSVAGQPWRWRRQGGDELDRSLLDQLLLARGVHEEDLPRQRTPTIRDFLPDPSAFRRHGQGRRATRRCRRWRERRSRSSAITTSMARPSAALLTLLLRRLGADPMVYIPDRLMEGYGPSGTALVALRERGASLAITVDCGAQAFDALDEAAAGGLEVIVCDHHQCVDAPSGRCGLDQPEPARRERDWRGPRPSLLPSGWPSCSASHCSANCAVAAISSTAATSPRSSTCSISSRSAPSPMWRG